MSDSKLSCPHCGQVIELAEQASRTNIVCVKCGKPFNAPIPPKLVPPLLQATPAKRPPRFLVIYGWAFIVISVINLVRYVLAALQRFVEIAQNPMAAMGGQDAGLSGVALPCAIVGLWIGFGLIRGRGWAILVLTAYAFIALLTFCFMMWPDLRQASLHENVMILGLRGHIFLLLMVLLNTFVLWLPPMVYGIIKRKELS